MIAHYQERSYPSPAALFHGSPADVTNRPPLTPAASILRDTQGARLYRIRRVLGLTVNQAAAMAQISRHAVKRAEQGQANLDGLAIGLLAAETKVQLANYVISGDYSGLAPGMIEELIQVEAAEQRAALEGTAAAGLPEPPGRKRRKYTARKASAGAKAGQQ